MVDLSRCLTSAKAVGTVLTCCYLSFDVEIFRLAPRTRTLRPVLVRTRPRRWPSTIDKRWQNQSASFLRSHCQKRRRSGSRKIRLSSLKPHRSRAGHRLIFHFVGDGFSASNGLCEFRMEIGSRDALYIMQVARVSSRYVSVQSKLLDGLAPYSLPLPLRQCLGCALFDIRAAVGRGKLGAAWRPRCPRFNLGLITHARWMSEYQHRALPKFRPHDR